jgi:hypothetical protein
VRAIGYSQIRVAIQQDAEARVQPVVLNVRATTRISLPDGVDVRVTFVSWYLSATEVKVTLDCVSALRVAALGDAPAATFLSDTVNLAVPLEAEVRPRTRSFRVPVGTDGGMWKRSSQVLSAERDAATPMPSSVAAAFPPPPA